MHLPPGNFGAYLFDCDGTIADSLPLHFRAWNEALAPFGASFPKALFFAWSGIPVPRTVEKLGIHFGLKLPVEEITAEREKRYLELLPSVTVVPEVLEHIEAMQGKIPFAVVSGSPRASVIQTLTFLNLLNRFPVIVGGDDCPNGKPHPDPYLLAAKRLGVEPASCLVFEDADLGVESARAAGMQWIKISPRQF